MNIKFIATIAVIAFVAGTFMGAGAFLAFLDDYRNYTGELIAAGTVFLTACLGLYGVHYSSVRGDKRAIILEKKRYLSQPDVQERLEAVGSDLSALEEALIRGWDDLGDDPVLPIVRRLGNNENVFAPISSFFHQELIIIRMEFIESYQLQGGWTDDLYTPIYQTEQELLDAMREFQRELAKLTIGDIKCKMFTSE